MTKIDKNEIKRKKRNKTLRNEIKRENEKKRGFGFWFWVLFLFLFFICLLQANRADNNCPCGKENRWFGEKKETEKPLKSRHYY